MTTTDVRRKLAAKDVRYARLFDLPFRGPEAVARFDHHGLFPDAPGIRFNPSLLAWGDGYLFCWRTGWAGSDVYAAALDRQFRPAGPAVRLALDHPAAAYGREDPRMFLHRGRPHVSFTGVVTDDRGEVVTNVLYARLTDSLQVERVWAPYYAARNYWEKNWVFFDHGGDLYAVYTIAPHRVLSVTGDAVYVSRDPGRSAAYDEPFGGHWAGGEMRGGTSPVRVGGEWWSFFHDSLEPGRVYRTGLYTFSAEPPFRPLRLIPEPLVVASESENASLPDPNYCPVVFPGGAVREGPRWLVAVGKHDRYAEILAFDHANLESRLLPVAETRPAPARIESRPPTPLSCVHEGSPVVGPDAPDVSRAWVTCDHPGRPIGGVVCRCRGCGPTCPGYEVDG